MRGDQLAVKTERRVAKKGSVLIVDDEEIMREVLETLLSSEGYRVDLAKPAKKDSRRTVAALTT
jgi:CheY-like chemotaxis protein